MPTISLRVSESQKIELEERSTGNVSDYIKAQLFDRPDPHAMLETVLQHLEKEAPQRATGRGASDQSLPMLMEILQLMRFTVKPEVKEKAQAEVERMGLKIMQAEDFGR
ncbi:hypothetical protein [Pseudomonas savastanoi]|uniref:Uncharacterized protein n=1 Tax=Pseudomonas savastanoi pv. glycinea TaxID=318 RepID=A0A3M3G6U2_PSESG|nr:hypothetical protein [Pseudomonas savastanoi]RMM69931.1 hypothetical protein ALQ73_200110 [Pseudomonas savastanoi pv. glycinea]